MTDINKAASEYKAAMDAYGTIDSEYKDALEAFETQHAALIEKRKAAKTAQDTAEKALREIVSDVYEETGNAPDVTYAGIRVNKEVAVSDATFINWCISNAPALLPDVCTVNGKRLKGLLEGITGSDGERTLLHMMPAFLVDKPTVTISKAKLPEVSQENEPVFQ